jgi:hypothetical protein
MDRPTPAEAVTEIGADDQDARDDLLACAAPLLWPMSGLIVVAVATLIAWLA